MYHPTQIMGILNITPDSFSGDGVLGHEQLMQHVESLLSAGAAIIDIGAESTRPGATPLSPEQEWQRLCSYLPDIITRAHKAGARISIDTRHAATAANALALGADIINDVSGCRSADMLAVLADSQCDIICMHSLSIPADPSITLAHECDVIDAIATFAQERLQEMQRAGIAASRIIFDPGIGFAKTPKQSLAILARIDELKALNTRLLVGHSRKSFLSSVTDAPFVQRDALTLAVSAHLLQHKVDMLRVHNVHLHQELLQLHTKLYASE